MVKNVQKWSKMVKNGQKWSKIVKNGQKWSKMVKNGQQNYQNNTIYIQHMYILQNMSKKLQNIFYRSSLVQLIAKNSLKLPKTDLKRPKYKEKVHQLFFIQIPNMCTHQPSITNIFDV